MTRNQLKAALRKKLRTIEKLTVELQRERQYSNMLSQLAYTPTQEPERLRQVRRASSLRKIARPRQIRKEAA